MLALVIRELAVGMGQLEEEGTSGKAYVTLGFGAFALGRRRHRRAEELLDRVQHGFPLSIVGSRCRTDCQAAPGVPGTLRSGRVNLAR